MTRGRHFYPQALPDGRQVAFTVAQNLGELADSVAVASLETGTVVPLGVGGRPLGLVGDRLVYRAATGALMTRRVDVGRGRAAGEPVALGETIRAGAASPTGVLVTLPERRLSRVEWVRPDDSGAEAVLPQAAEVADPRLSPDGRRLALAIRGSGDWEVWIQDLASGTLSRLATRGHRPDWTLDGTRVLYRDPTGALNLALQAADFAGAATPLDVRSPDAIGPVRDAVISPDGRTLLFVQNGDLFAAPLRGGAASTAFLRSPGNSQAPRFSPDGRWVAFHSTLSGRREVYVTPWPGPGPRHQVSTSGGTEPVWARDGRRLFYRDGARLVAATLDLSGTFAVTSRAVLLEGDFASDPTHAQYDVAPDGRFVMLRGGEPSRLTVVLNWRPTEDTR